MQYYAFVKLAKEANATYTIRKTALVDLDKMDQYMEQFKDGGQ